MSVEQLALPVERPTLPGCVDGIVSLDPPELQCHDCGATWTEGRRISLAVILSCCSGWGFLQPRHCQHPKVRRCGECNDRHRAEHKEPRQ